MNSAPVEGRNRVNPDDLDEIDSLFFDREAETRPEPRSSRTVALISPKGGTGKTSVAIMLAGCLTTRRRQVGLMDLDPRHGAEKWSQAGNGLPFPIFTFDANRGATAFRRTLRQASHEVELLIIDTLPAMGPEIELALQVSDLVLVPTGASALDLEAAQEAIDAARNARYGRDGDLPRMMAVPSRQDGRTRLAKEFDHRLKDLNIPVSPAVGQRVEVAVAANSGRLVRPTTVAGKEFRRLSRHVWSFLRQLDGEDPTA
jgi:chromosome partitioning protein